MGNMLENTVECTCEEFVAEIAGKRRKPYLDALKSTFRTIVLGKSTLVKEMSSFLRENEGRLERKRVQELMSEKSTANVQPSRRSSGMFFSSHPPVASTKS